MNDFRLNANTRTQINMHNTKIPNGLGYNLRLTQMLYPIKFGSKPIGIGHKMQK